ncbi:MAG: hypothetical protein ATN35_03420 [Epulopiscium sp. Nele67-Bin004]|nr:MAG: hypothetical protein ATN35_03420 [Epulopiscium sp. Nele67-Bin004]
MKKFGITLLATLFCGINVFGSPHINLLINNNLMTSNTQQIDATTLVPVRLVSEQLGATVTWDNPTITIFKGDINIQLQIDNTIATINGVETTLAVAPTIANDTTLVPLRFVSEALGVSVDWDNETYTVLINSTRDQLEFIPKYNSKQLYANDANISRILQNPLPADVESYKSFITTIEYENEGFLCDIDNNGVEELVLFYWDTVEDVSTKMVGIYTLYENRAVELLTLPTSNVSDNDLSEISVAEKDGNFYLYIATQQDNHSGEITVYELVNTELSTVDKLTYAIEKENGQTTSITATKNNKKIYSPELGEYISSFTNLKTCTEIYGKLDHGISFDKLAEQLVN